MTNEEIIRYTRYLAKKHEDDTVLTFETNFHMAFTDIANHIENQAKYNTELELMIKMYKQLVGEQADLNMEQFKQIDEQTQAIDNYNKALQSWTDANNNLLRLVGDLKDEIEQLKAIIEADDVKKDFKEFCDKRDKEESKLKFRGVE